MVERNNHHLGWVRVTSFPFFYGWVIVAVAGLTHFTAAPGQTYVISIFLEPMIEDMEWSRTIFSSLYTVGSMTAALFMVGVGRALDRFGARRTLVILCFFMGLATFWMSSVDAMWELFIGFALLRTIGLGSFGLVATTMISTWFIRLRGRATAIASLGGATSMAAFPVLVHILIEYFEWRQTWVVLGILVWTLLLLPALVFIRRSPEDVGILPDGNGEYVTADVDSLGKTLACRGRNISEGVEVPSGEVHFSLGEAMRTRSLWMLVFSSVAQPLIMTGLMFHHVSILGTKGLSPGLAAASMGLFGPLMLFSNLVCGYLADRIANRILLTAGQAILIISMLWLVTTNSAWEAVVYIVLSSLSVGLIGTTGTVIWANYFGRKHLGSIRGFATTVMVGFSALGALPFGILYDRSGSYDSAILVLLVLPVIACVSSFLAFPPQKSSSTPNIR